MAAISGVDGTDSAALAVRIAEQNRLSAKAPSTADSTASLTSKLNALYGTDGTNKASGNFSDVAGMLGVDTETLTTQLQGSNAGKVKELMQQAALLKTFQNLDDTSSSGNVFDTKA